MPAANSVYVPCTQCSKPVKRTARHRRITKKHFCGFRCYGRWQRVHRVGFGRKRLKIKCLYCGRVCSKQPNQVLESGRAFCNGPCYWAWRGEVSFLSGPDNSTWKGGSVGYRGPNWTQQSRAARKRDNNTCQRCGKKERGMAVHHVVPFRLFDGDYKTANQLTNLSTLCGYCHGKAEQEFWASHPEYAAESPFPLRPIKMCKDCGTEYVSRSGSSNSCDQCCTRDCGNCGKEFYRRRGRNKPIVYCSKKCWRVYHSSPRFTSSAKT